LGGGAVRNIQGTFCCLNRYTSERYWEKTKQSVPDYWISNEGINT